MRHGLWICLAATCALCACKGDKGDPGPEGQPGQQGATGAAGPAGTWSAIQGGVAQAIATTVTINAKSDCGAIAPAPHMEVFADHVRIGGSDITNSTYADVQFTLSNPSFIGELTVVYTNDGNASGCDHNLYVDHVTLSTGATVTSTDTQHVLLDKMSGTSLSTAFDGLDVAAASPTMGVNSGLRFFIGATGHLSSLGGAANPIFSTKSSAVFFTSTAANTWQFTGESITLSAPPEQPARYRIWMRQMAASSTGTTAYCEFTLSDSTATPGTVSVTGLGQPHGSPAPGYWQTTSTEGFFQVPAGQTVTLNVNLYSYINANCQLANSIASGNNYTTVIAWPL